MIPYEFGTASVPELAIVVIALFGAVVSGVGVVRAYQRLRRLRQSGQNGMLRIVGRMFLAIHGGVLVVMLLSLVTGLWLLTLPQQVHAWTPRVALLQGALVLSEATVVALSVYVSHVERRLARAALEEEEHAA